MYLKRLVIHGFKSFADRTVIELEPGVTGVVGPNGCGKSNVADAIKWVLGEQSPKSLRASTMQDVLFEGTDSRPQMSFSEVTLLFTDCEKQLGTAFNEVEVGRRVERDGQSEYFLNGKACRLKDIQQLFRDTGIGRVSYSFLQQGQIDKLLSANPLDRRAVFEEAAGVSGFRAKREETLRKLTDVENNLARLSDILSEVLSQMGSLKRQAAKAVRATRIKKQLNALDLAIVGHDYQNLEEQLQQKSALVAPLEESLRAKQEKLSTHERSLSDVEGRMGELLAKQQGLSGSIFEKRSAREEALSHAKWMNLRATEALERIASLEENLKALKADSDASKQHLAALENNLLNVRQLAEGAKKTAIELARAHEDGQKAYEKALADEVELRSLTLEQEGQMNAFKKALSDIELESHGLQSALEPVAAQRETLGAEKERMTGESAEIASSIKLCSEQLDILRARELSTRAFRTELEKQNATEQTAFEELGKTHAGLVAERDYLRQMQSRYEGLGEPTKNLLETGGWLPVVENMDVDPRAIRAIEALLTAELEAVYSRNPAAFDLSKLQNGQKVALVNYGKAHILTKVPEEIPHGLERAIAFVKSSQLQGFLEKRLEGCYICANATRFEELLRDSPSFEFKAIANLAGATIDHGGLYCAGSSVDADKRADTFLARSRRLQELDAEISESQAKLLGAKTALAGLENDLNENSKVISEAAQRIAALSAQRESLGAAADKIASDISKTAQQIALLDEKTAHNKARVEELAGKRAVLFQDLSQIVRVQSQNTERSKALEEELAQMRIKRDQAHTMLAEARLKEAQSQHNLEVHTENMRVLQSRVSELESRQTLVTEEITRLRHDIEGYRSQAKEKTDAAEQLSTVLLSLEGDLQALKTQIEEQEGLSISAKTARETIRGELSIVQESLMKANLTVSELNGRKSLLIEEHSRRFGAEVSPSTINWRAKLYEYEFFARADESSLDLSSVELPSAEELLGRYGVLNREAVTADCSQLRQKLDSIGPINESALDDYKVHEGRYSALKTQVDDLQAAKTELSTALVELEGQSAALFTAAFEAVRGNFCKTFERLFGGGRADLFMENPADPLNSGIDIMAHPPGTQLKSLGLLSGGQKTMTAVALLFAIYQVKPSPFCVLDELDAPLDDANIGRFLEMLKDFTAWSQFVIITHNRRTMASADILYGVTMKERGVSRIISMRLSQAQEFSKTAQKSDSPKESPAEVNTPVVETTLEEKTEAAAEAVSEYSLDSLKEKVTVVLSKEPTRAEGKIEAQTVG
jgi:chromosome segregation protein